MAPDPSPRPRWRLARFDELSPTELYELMTLRQRVFVVEQRCAYLDADGRDPLAWHLWARDPAGGPPLACARLFGPGAGGAPASIGRVLTAPEARRQGLGRELMGRAVTACERLFGRRPIALGAQRYLERFYEEWGFRRVGPDYDEDGIPHVPMLRPGDDAARPRGVERGRVRLRPIEEGDVDDILGWVNDPEVVGNLAAFSGEPFTREQELAYVRAMRASESDRVYSILAADDGRYLGQIGLHQIHWRSRVGRLSVVVARREEMGRGFGSAAIASLLDLAFADLGLHKVWLMVFEHNHRSRGIYARLGFRVEGRLREEYFHQDRWHTMVRMSLLASEWDPPAEERSARAP